MLQAKIEVRVFGCRAIDRDSSIVGGKQLTGRRPWSIYSQDSEFEEVSNLYFDAIVDNPNKIKGSNNI